MARYFVTGFAPRGGCTVGVNGIFVGDQTTAMSVDDIVFDPYSATTAKEQIKANLPAAANRQLADLGIDAVLSGADIEYIT